MRNIARHPKRSSNILSKQRVNKKHIIVFSLIGGIFGSYLVYQSFASSPSSSTIIQPQAKELLTSSLIKATTKDQGSNDKTYWQDGWFYTNGVDLSDQLGSWVMFQESPANAAAISWRYGDKDPKWVNYAITTMNKGIDTYQEINGSIGSPAGGANGGDIHTSWFGALLGSTYLALESQLDQPTKIKWNNAMKGMADYLICHPYPLNVDQPNIYNTIAVTDPCIKVGQANRDDQIRFYTNGNINLHQIEQLYLTYKVTGEQRYMDAVNEAYSFLIDPEHHGIGYPQWRGYGLRIEKQPTKADGSDGTGYLTETGAGGTGFDPDYADLQGQIAARLYLESKDPRFLRLLNLITNKSLEITNKNTFIGDFRCGTRRNYTAEKCAGPNQVKPEFNICPAPAGQPEKCWQAGGMTASPAIEVLVWHGGRADLEQYVASHYARVQTEIRRIFEPTKGSIAPGEYRWLASSLAVIVQAAATAPSDNEPDPVPPDTTKPTVSISFPPAGTTISGTAVTVSANANDNIGVTGVQFKLDGANIGTEDITAPYSFTGDTTKLANGSHTLSAVARDAAGNTATASIGVTVNNIIPPPDTVPTKLADANGDNIVNSADLAILSSNWGKTGRTKAQGDFNNDNIVNSADLAILSSGWGK